MNQIFKRILSCVLAVCMMLSCAPTIIADGEASVDETTAGTITLNATNVTLAKSDSEQVVNVNLYMDKNAVIAGLEVQYAITLGDNAQLGNGIPGNGLSGSPTSQGMSVTNGNGSNMTFNQGEGYVLCTVPITIAAGASGSYKIVFSNIEISDADIGDGYNLASDTVTATITISEATGYGIYYTLVSTTDNNTNNYMEYKAGDDVTANIFIVNNTGTDVTLQAYDIYLTYDSKLSYKESNMTGALALTANSSTAANAGEKVTHIEAVGDGYTAVTLPAGTPVPLGTITFTISEDVTHGTTLPITITIGENAEDVTNISIGEDKTSYYPVNTGTVLGAEVYGIYTVTWKSQDGTTTYETDSNVPHGTAPSYGGTAPTKDATAQYTYTFEGWATSTNAESGTEAGSLPVVSADVTYYAAFSTAINSYEVSFDMNGHGTEIKSQTIEYGGKATQPTDPTVEGYTFGGWYTDSACTAGKEYNFDTKVTGDTTLYAKWTINTYTIIFDANGGNGVVPENITAEYNQTITMPDGGELEKTDWVFTGWAKDSTATEPEYTATAGSSYTNLSTENGAIVTLYAVWKQDVFNITYTHDPANVSVTSELDSTYSSETGLNIVDPKATGYTFKGWTSTALNISTATKNVSIPANTTGVVDLKAHWIPNTYTITLNANGGKIDGNESKNVTVTYDSTYSNLEDPTRTGYTFAGWFTEEEGGTQVTSSTTVATAENHVLYAHWTANEYTIAFNGNGATDGSMTSIENVKYDETTTLTANAYTRNGYKFVGWATSADGTKLYDDKEEVSNLTDVNSETVTLYAVWDAIEYTITFVVPDGTPIDEMTYTIETGGTLLAAEHSKSYLYSFDNWLITAAEGNWIANTTKDAGAFSGFYGDVTLTAQWKVAFAYKIESYKFADTGYVMLRIATASNTNAYTFGGEKMYYTDDVNYRIDGVNVFVTLIPVMDEKTKLVDGTTLTAEGLAKLAQSNEAATEISRNGDVNSDGVVNIADANVVYQMVINTGAYYTGQLTTYQRLAADIHTGHSEGDLRGTLDDVNKLVNEVINEVPANNETGSDTAA